jgi:hypothetical protein
VAGTAFGREERLAGRRVAHDDLEHDRLGSGRRIALSTHGGRHAVNVFRKRFHIVVGEAGKRRHGRHAGVLAAIVDDREDELSLLIVENELRAQKVDPAHVAAAKVRAVADAAVHTVEPLTASDEHRITGRTLLGGERRGIASSAPALCGNGRLRSSGRRVRRGRRLAWLGRRGPRLSGWPDRNRRQQQKSSGSHSCLWSHQ